MKSFTLEDKNKFLGQTTHIEDTNTEKNQFKFKDVDEKVISAEGEDKITPYILFVCITAGFAGFLFDKSDIIDYATKQVIGVIGSITVVIGDSLDNKPLSTSNQEVITALAVAGALLSSLVAGTIADKIGRKYTLVIADVCYVIGTVLFAAAYSVAQAAVGRLVIGFGVGFSSCVGPLFISEISPTQIRGRLVTINSVSITFGQCVAYGLGAALMYAPHGWRIMLVLGAVPALYQAIAIHLLPESPRWLLTQNSTEKAYNALSRMYPKASEEELSLKFDVLTANVDESVKIAREIGPLKALKLLFTEPKNLRGVSLAMALQGSQQLSGFNGLMYFAPTLFSTLGFKNPSSGGLIVAATNFVFTSLGMMIVDKVGRRRLVCYVSAPGVILGCVWSIVAFYYLTIDTGFNFVEGTDYPMSKQIALIMGWVFFVALYGVGLGHVPWTMADLFSLDVRGVGVSIGTATNWSCNLAISESYLTMQQSIHPFGTFALFAGFTLCGWIFLTLCYPETTGLPLEEVEKLFSDGYNVRKSMQLRAERKQTIKQYRKDRNENA